MKAKLHRAVHSEHVTSGPVALVAVKMAAFSEMGVMPEIAQAVEEMDWLLPTDIQAESIPLILGGGDVLMAAETGSGKTGAFSIPVIQIVYETLMDQQEGKKGRASVKTGGAVFNTWQMNPYDRSPAFGSLSCGLVYQSSCSGSGYCLQNLQELLVIGGVAAKEQLAVLEHGVIVCSATLHSFDVKKLSERIMHFPTWVDLKGEDSVPETVHHVVVPVNPKADRLWERLGKNHIQVQTVKVTSFPVFAFMVIESRTTGKITWIASRLLICTDVAARGIDISGVPYGTAFVVWYHVCPNRGKGCYNTRLKEDGGCTIWYNEKEVSKVNLSDALKVNVVYAVVCLNQFSGKCLKGGLNFPVSHSLSSSPSFCLKSKSI
ncbi:hypothetical protein GOODEAATRI_005290 [Goodea atripinnis]|uniref:ATP-dependent RNA helicase n=1 Tax=Goodea atripinnis TaxID=208336 RepID=A0ABV0N834_9TELE